MKQRQLLFAAAVTIAAAAVVVMTPSSDASVVTAQEAACCFKNPAYTGTCRVVPAEGETCASILAYLNNPMAEGKSYCGGTQVRQGWTLVACEDEAETR